EQIASDIKETSVCVCVCEMDTYGNPGDRPPNPIFREHSLLPAKNSLFPEIFSLLICVGNFTRSRCGTAVSRNEIRFRGTKIAKFPVNFPVSRELPPETGSYLTAHTTTQP